MQARKERQDGHAVDGVSEELGWQVKDGQALERYDDVIDFPHRTAPEEFMRAAGFVGCASVVRRGVAL